MLSFVSEFKVTTQQNSFASAQHVVRPAKVEVNFGDLFRAMVSAHRANNLDRRTSDNLTIPMRRCGELQGLSIVIASLTNILFPQQYCCRTRLGEGVELAEAVLGYSRIALEINSSSGQFLML
jgi:hypothetical protein